MKKWYDSLTEKKKEHLKSIGCLRKVNFVWQTEHQQKTCADIIARGQFPCIECYDIANKLGMWKHS